MSEYKGMDKEAIRETLADLLAKKGFTVRTARDGREALEELKEARFALMIFDIKMPGISGIELYNEIIKGHEYLKGHLIAVTGDVFSADVKEFLTELAGRIKDKRAFVSDHWKRQAADRAERFR